MTETAADEQDLAKALDSVASAASSLTPPTAASTDQAADQSDTPDTSAGAVASPFGPSPAPAPAASDDIASLLTAPATAPAATPEPTVAPTPTITPSSVASDHHTAVDDGPLAAIKQDAIVELRPLVDKLNVSAEEKFDTYLLLIRSTDDTELIGPAHEAAKAIEDETRRAEALLDIIKEIDYLSNQAKA